MAGFAAMLSDADVRSVAAHYLRADAEAGGREETRIWSHSVSASIAAGSRPRECRPAQVATARSGAGIPAQYPQLHGQYAEYTEAQLVAFRQGERRTARR